MKPITRGAGAARAREIDTQTGHTRQATTLRAVGAEVADDVGLRDAFLTHGGEMFGFACRLLSAPTTAEDAVQETFARAWRSRVRFDPTLGSLRTWLFTIERRVILDITARQGRATTVPYDEGAEPSMTDGLDAAIRGWQVDAALQRLRPEHRAVLIEIYFNGRSGREVAELFGIPEGTVRSRAFYALRSLRLHLEEDGWN